MTADVPVQTSVGQVPMERLRTVFDGMFDGVWLIGSDGLTTYTAMFAIKAQHRMQA